MSHSPCTVPVHSPPPFEVRRAAPGEAEALTALCRAAKRHWGYPPDWMEAWAGELRVTPEAIRRQEIFVAWASDGSERLGFSGCVGKRRSGGSSTAGWHPNTSAAASAG